MGSKQSSMNHPSMPLIPPSSLITMPIIVEPAKVNCNGSMISKHLSQNAIYELGPHIIFSIITTMLALMFDFGMATAPITGYIMQYRLILVNKSVGAFSIDICLVLLFANIMRLNFYLFRHYQTALVFQSIFMIAAQILLLRVCTFYQEKPPKQQSEIGLNSVGEAVGEEEEDFWRWSSFQKYVKCIVAFLVGSFAVSIVMWAIEVTPYGDFIGLVALLSESLLILPQIIQIFKQGRVGGISYLLIFLNLFGDVIKMYYFILKDQPFQFKLCGGIQLFLDSFVILQIWFYKSREGLTEIEEESVEGQIKGSKQKQTQNDNLQAKDLQGSISQTTVLESLEQVEQGEAESTTNQ